MKEIWINLELYIKSYEFSIFRDFFRIFLNLFQFLNGKNELKMAKSGVISVRVHVDATWHSRPRGSVTRAHAAPTRCDIYLHIYYIYYIMHKVQPSVYWKGIQTL